MNYKRIYEYRFKNVNNEKKKAVWIEIAKYFYETLNMPRTILDPAGGMCEFINAFQASEKWVVDVEASIKEYVSNEVKAIIGDIMQIELPQNYFDAIFVSNFIEHLNSQKQVSFFLNKMYLTLKKGGKIAIIGPNFKYAYREYFDFSDHTVILSELGIAEHLYGSGFSIKRIYPKFLPFSFTGRLPVNPFLVKTYLKFPLIWNFFGKQFLVMGEK